MTVFAAKAIWVIGTVIWFAIRYPHARKARRIPKLRSSGRRRERVLLGFAGLMLYLLPLIYLIGGQPKFADYPFSPVLAWLGLAVFAGALWLLHRSHTDLGKNWSIALDIRDQHSLVTNGVYCWVRHPMYSAFWLCAASQALLLPNWIAGPAGVLGIAALFFFRVPREEELMLETFGAEYREYMSRTARILPWIY
jgi:protein-S-isoprenylcysteine O-methyltransferase Ste14